MWVDNIEKFTGEPLNILGVRIGSFIGLGSRHHIKVREPMIVSKYTHTISLVDCDYCHIALAENENQKTQ